MTTLGKILVFLTFLAALGMGGLMIYLANSTPKWKQAYEDSEEYNKTLKAIADQETASRKRWVTEAEKLKQQLDAALIEARGEKERLRAYGNDKEEQRKKYEMQMNQANLALEQSKKEAQRIQSELNFTLSVIEAREKSVLLLQQEIVGHIQTAQNAKNERDTAVARAQALFEKLKQTELAMQEQAKQLALKQGGGGMAQVGQVNSWNFRNPPPVFVEGSVMVVDKNLVKISVGLDMGVKKDNTLEIFRLEPEPKYLGRLLVLDADFRHSMARLIPQPGVSLPILQVGDKVATKLQ